MIKIGRANLFKFKKKNKFLIHSVSQTKGGPSLATGPYLWVDDNVSKEELIKEVLFVISCSQTDLPIQKDLNSFSEQFLSNIGLKRHSEFYKDCLHVSVVLKDGILSFIPMANKGSQGFINVPNVKIAVESNQSIDEKASALQEALNKSE